MAKFWSDIVVPAAIAAVVMVQTVGVEAGRSVRLHGSLSAAPPDTLLAEEEFDLFAQNSPADTLPKVFARDTMKVPDSLRTTDPFLYQWYVAVKDGYTHRLVVDSLKAEGDSLLWPRIDSLYLADSAAVAQAAWERKFAAMSRAEQKRWIYENVELPRILHRQDSIFHRKDSLQHIRDSIIQNTPRILETPFLPDSLHFKRLVSWHHNPMNNKVEPFQWDTTANYRFYDYPFMRKDVGASWLGMPGSAVQTYNFFLRDAGASPSFYSALESWTYTPASLPQFNTKTPYTELEYFGNLFTNSSLSADNFRVFTTQNILPSLNISLEMKRYGGAGTLKNEKTVNRTLYASANYLGKKYLSHGGVILNKGSREESGGVQDNAWVRDTTVDVREIEVNLAAAANTYKKVTAFYDQSYRIPLAFIERLRHRKDTAWTPSDSLNRDITTGFIGTSTEYSVYNKKYADKTSAALSAFYNNVFNIDPSASSDSLHASRLENRIFLRLQPWKEDAIVSKVEAGVGNRLQHFYLVTPTAEDPTHAENFRWNSFYAYGGAEGSLSRYFSWDALGLVNFAGTEAGDFTVQAGARFSFYPFRRDRKSPVTLGARFETSLREPDFYQQHFYSNHFQWENSFGKTSTTRLSATLDIPHWRLKAQAGYSLVAGHVYYDTQGIVQQHAPAVNVLMAGLSHHLAAGVLHLENSALVQVSSAPEVLPLPTFALNARYYVQFNIVDAKVLQMQLGINTRYTTKWYAPWYNPVAGVFALQDQELYGNTPVTDVFVNMQWKKCCLFLKYENAGRGWPSRSHDFFTAHHYIQTAPALKFGISWPFYPSLAANRTLSGRASDTARSSANR